MKTIKLRENELKKEIKKAQLKCCKESYDFDADNWNAGHFTYCKSDVLDTELKGIQEERKRILKIVAEETEILYMHPDVYSCWKSA